MRTPVLMLFFACLTVLGGEPRQIGHGLNDTNLHLFVDDYEIARSTNLLRVVNRIKKHPQPVLVADKPWEGNRAQAWGSVIQETNGLLRMWYFAMNTDRVANEMDRGGYCYAESRDGIHWTKPNLGLVEFRGSKANNLFYTFSPDGKNVVDEELARRGEGLPAYDLGNKEIGVVNNADGISVVRDDAEPDPQKLYKLIANMQDHRMWTYYMRDKYPNVTDAQVKQAQAMHGQYMDTSPDGLHWTRKPIRLLGAKGDYMMVLPNERAHDWWLNERMSGHSIRNAALRTSKDLIHWTEPQMMFDSGPENNFGKLWEWHGGMTPFNCGNMNLGFLERWSAAGFGNYCELVCNRIGETWQRVEPGHPFLDIGPEGSFDRALAFPTHNAPLRIGNELYIFYTGGGATLSTNQGMPMSIGVATIGVDRFAGMACWRGAAGELVTKSTTITGGRLELNVEPLDHTRIRVAVSKDGKALPGFGFEDSQCATTTGEIYQPAVWKDHKLAELCGQSVSLHFEIKGAVLYGFRFKD
ncbi:MAG: hypothetical protein ACXWDN_01645 [Limisphaerales bacterium]